MYLTERVPQLKHGMNVARELALIAWAYRDRPMTSLADVCKAIQIKWKDDLSPATIRARIRYLTAACRYAWKHHGYGENDPASRVTVPQVKNERQIYIGRAQMLAIARKTSNRQARMAVRMAFYSGMRLSEILKAAPRDGRWHLLDTKNGEPRIVPIHPRVAVCARRFEAPARITVQAHFRRAAKAAGMAGLHFHDLRHSAASELINNGVDLYTVGAVLGHKDARSTKRYAHLATDKLADAIGVIGQKIPTTKLRRVA